MLKNVKQVLIIWLVERKKRKKKIKEENGAILRNFPLYHKQCTFKRERFTIKNCGAIKSHAMI